MRGRASIRDTRPSSCYVPSMKNSTYGAIFQAGARLPLCVFAISGMLGLAGCGGGSAGNKQPAPAAMDTPAPGSSAKTSISTSLGLVDACSLLSPADFATATDKVQPKGFPASSYTLRTQKVKTDVSPAVDQHSACTYYF